MANDRIQWKWQTMLIDLTMKYYQKAETSKNKNNFRSSIQFYGHNCISINRTQFSWSIHNRRHPEILKSHTYDCLVLSPLFVCFFFFFAFGTETNLIYRKREDASPAGNKLTQTKMSSIEIHWTFYRSMSWTMRIQQRRRRLRKRKLGEMRKNPFILYSNTLHAIGTFSR